MTAHLTPPKRDDPETFDSNDPSRNIDDIDYPPVVTLPPPYSVYTLRQKWCITFLVSFAGMLSPLTSNIFFPVIPKIAQDLGTSILQINLSVTWYMILQGVSPSFFGACTDVIGRRPVYLATLTIYVAASIGLANTNVYWLLVVLRCVQASGSASVISIGSGTIGDISPPSERGGFMALSNLGIMAGPAWAPVVGGLLAGRFGWQSIFWFLTALGGAVFVVMLFTLPETLRAMVGDGSIPARGINRSLLALVRSHRRVRKIGEKADERMTLPAKKSWRDIDLLAPIKMFREKDILLTLTFNSSVYMLWYALTTSTSTSLKTRYGLSETQLGLCFIANGVGCIVASVMNGPRLDKDYKIVSRSLSTECESRTDQHAPTDQNDLAAFPIEHARLRSLPPFFAMVIISHITYAWTVQHRVHLSVPLIMQFFAGLGVTTMLNSVSVLLVDLYPHQAASATAANNLYRCLCGAAGTAIIEPLINALGEGWALTILSLLCCVLTPLIFAEWRYGMRFRAERAARVQRRLRGRDAR